jgi:DNA-binding transcriptional MocR family regulator
MGVCGLIRKVNKIKGPAAIKAIKDGFTKYTPVGGIDPLKDAIIEKFRKDNELSYNRDEIIVSCGAKHSLYNIAQALAHLLLPIDAQNLWIFGGDHFWFN